MTKTVICELCPKQCEIPDGYSGDCRVRINIDGKLTAVTYGRPVSVHIDPIEKKPLFHFLPGSGIFSIATAGCNLHCLNCQNWEISQQYPTDIEAYRAPPDKLINAVINYRCISIAYTYSDPVIFYEYVYESSVMAHKKGLKNVLVTAGYINEKPLRKLAKYIDASNTDLKSFDNDFYVRQCSATLKPVLDGLVIQKEEGIWLEVTYLLIPTLNDNLERIGQMCKWMVKNLGADTPLHFSRFFPLYKSRHLPPTPEESLRHAREVALNAGINYVYVGNLIGNEGENTYCPNDKTLLIRRVGYEILEYNLDNDGRCPKCKQRIEGVWKT